MDMEGKVGPQVLADGAKAPLRLSRSGALIVADGSPRWMEAVLRGNCYAAYTAASGVAPGTVIGTTGPYTLYNPKASGKRLVVLAASLGYISGTLGAGVVVFAANADPTAAAATGTAIVPVPLLLGSRRGVAQPFTTSTIPSPTLVRPFCNLTALLASTAVGVYQVREEVAGGLVVPEGCGLTLQGIAAAGATPLVLLGMEWEEVDE